MDFWTKSVCCGACIFLTLLTLMVMSTESLPTHDRPGTIQENIFNRERRSAVDRELASELFTRGDLNDDNLLSSSEITIFYENVIGFPPNLATFMATGFMRNGDNNGDHQLNFDETMDAIRMIEG
ncbi:uncharacterized protein LOC110446940 [Mizuhopecten yessoensis]|uniref:EF-hand domain-containing protein n=1 Tax=Mizuhopecten yessoensis TaxID=6573 RepID=A0A210QWH5_MIZYE|nr:uncharacterized protein LOC110446940 [Mizuhopecten yessoensis]OWF53036.1 hypothetical protein KP79_PYT22412 [Mizuhopecten yessoensis]